MVFSSVPLYLDPPNWQQHQNQQPRGISTEIGSQQLPPPPPLPGIGGGGGGDGGSSRPGSMAERARLGNIPQPETALKCPRCESTNTKFCYFNNYSLSQPRHFCKTCRRYWTRGGALRNVPVGGGCRRNKRSSKANNSTNTSARSKSPAVILTENHQLATSTTTTDSIFHAPPPLPLPQLPILPPLPHHLSDFNSGLGFGGIQAPEVAAGGGGGSLLSSGLVEQWRLPQYPFLSGGLEPTTGFFSLESDGQLRSSKPLIADNSGDVNQFASVKMEDNNIQGLNLSRNFLGITGNDHQYWTTINNNNAWATDHHNLPGFNPSSTTHLL